MTKSYENHAWSASVATDAEQKQQTHSFCLQLVVEPSGAVGLAAALKIPFKTQPRLQNKQVGIVLCGGNVDLAAMGLWKVFKAAVAEL